MNLQIEPCIPPRWAKSGHRQTLIAYGLPSEQLTQPYKAVQIPLSDGDVLTGRYYAGTSTSLVVIFHGLIGSVDSTYMARTALRALRQNHSVLLMNHRGCGEGVTLAKGIYHSGRGDDISEVMAFCRQTWPTKQLVAIGFSLSANALLTLLTGQRGTHLPDKAITVNGPADLKASSDSLKKGFNRLYDLFFVHGCRKEIAARKKQKWVDDSLIIRPWAYLEEIDEAYTAPLGGFRNALDYYEQCSTYLHFQKIKTPTFMLMSKDDPFIPWEPYLQAQGNPNVSLHLENHGGHMGYLAQTRHSLKPQRWMDDTLDLVLKEMTH